MHGQTQTITFGFFEQDRSYRDNVCVTSILEIMVMVGGTMEQFSIEQLRSILELRHEAVHSGVPVFEASKRGMTQPEAISPDGSVGPGGIGWFSEDPLRSVETEVIFKEIRSRQKAIYGDDDRIELAASSDQNHLRVGGSVAAIILTNDVVPIDDSQSSISAMTLAQRSALRGRPLCSRELYRDQPASAAGTAFLVAPDIIATAHHCISESNLHTVRVIFDFAADGAGNIPTVFNAEDIYAPTRFIAGEFTENRTDWALIKLDRPVVGRDPLEFRRSGEANLGTPLYVIGHPLGLPKKIAGNAEIRLGGDDAFFVANLDTYGGNSGSPVFNAITHVIEGILVRGETDFAPLGSCYASLVCPVGGCRGEECARMTPIAQHFQNVV